MNWTIVLLKTSSNKTSWVGIIKNKSYKKTNSDYQNSHYLLTGFNNSIAIFGILNK